MGIARGGVLVERPELTLVEQKDWMPPLSRELLDALGYGVEDGGGGCGADGDFLLRLPAHSGDAPETPKAEGRGAGLSTLRAVRVGRDDQRIASGSDAACPADRPSSRTGDWLAEVAIRLVVYKDSVGEVCLCLLDAQIVDRLWRHLVVRKRAEGNGRCLPVESQQDFSTEKVSRRFESPSGGVKNRMIGGHSS